MLRAPLSAEPCRGETSQRPGRLHNTSVTFVVLFQSLDEGGNPASQGVALAFVVAAPSELGLSNNPGTRRSLLTIVEVFPRGTFRRDGSIGCGEPPPIRYRRRAVLSGARGERVAPIFLAGRILR